MDDHPSTTPLSWVEAPSEEHPQQHPKWDRPADGEGIVWPEPVDILAERDAGAPLLTERHIPDAIWPFVSDTAERMGVATSSVALAALVSCASMINEEWLIQPKRSD